MSYEDDVIVRVMHGTRLVVPPEWEDSSLYRFNAPPDEAEVPEAERGSNRRLQPNVLITRHERSSGDPPERFFEVTNQAAKQANPTFEVVRYGPVEYLGQIASWQDTRFNDPQASVKVFQRQLIVPSWPRHFTLITLTGTEKAVIRMSEQMQLGHLTSAPPPRHEVHTSGGVVAGRLRSKVDDES